MLLYIILGCVILSLLVSSCCIIKVIKLKNNNGISVESKQLIKEENQNTLNMINQISDSQQRLLSVYNQNVVDNVKNLITINQQELQKISTNVNELVKTNEQKMDKLILTTDSNIAKLQESNEKKLEEMRITVDEKLNTSLEKRLNESFSLISQRLEAVSAGLGEMRTLATGVGDLKKVLTNVKTRGVFGEVQLNTLLEQILSPNQYEVQAMVKQNSQDRVDFAIHYPTSENNTVLLPIDAKFPMEDYLRLIESEENQDGTAVAQNQKALIKRIKEEAKSIKDKYINIPTTTDFAIMYLPTEGLYAEVLKSNGLVEQLQRDYKIIICGPTTICALLNSFQMGFRTMAIEKRSGEIWNMLSSFKKEFGIYVELLAKTQKKLTEATDTIENATKKSEKIQKQLSKVDDLDVKDFKLLSTDSGEN